MEQQNTRLRNVGFITFFFSGICAISSGVVVSLLQEQYGFAYGMTGTLLSLMSIGNLLAGFLIAMLPGKLGMKPSILLLTIGYALGYAMMGLSGAVAVLALGFFLVGIAKGSVINTCTILVSDNSADRTRGMNLMHSCYACGALLCPFFIAAAGRVSGSFAVLVLAVLGLLLWLVYMGTPFAVIQTVCREDILVVQQNEIILRRRSDQCTAHRCCAICIDQRVAFQILVLYATAGTQHRRQCKDEHKQSIPFHGFAPFVRFCHSRSAPSRARAAFFAFASS